MKPNVRLVTPVRAVCQHCGTWVEQRHLTRFSFYSVALIVALILVSVSAFESWRQDAGVVVAGGMVLYFIIGYVGWRVLPWDSVPPSASEPADVLHGRAAWRVLYADTIDRDRPTKIDAHCVGLASGLAELWARHMFESVRPDGAKGFSSVRLEWWRGCVHVDGSAEGARRLRSWLFGAKSHGDRGYAEEADREVLETLAGAHAHLIDEPKAAQEILALAEACADAAEFRRRLRARAGDDAPERAPAPDPHIAAGTPVTSPPDKASSTDYALDTKPTPCCAVRLPRHVRDLADVDEMVGMALYQCPKCQRYWVDVCSPDYGVRFWESVPAEDLEIMLHTHNRGWMWAWAESRGLIP